MDADQIQTSGVRSAQSDEKLKHAPKRSVTQRAADLLFMERLHLRGWTQAEIAGSISRERPYSISRQQVGHDLKKLRDQWQKTLMAEMASARGMLLRKLVFIEAEAWNSWEASKQGRLTGNVAILCQLIQLQDRTAKLLGLYAPIQEAITKDEEFPAEANPCDRALTPDEADDLIARHYERIQQRKKENRAAANNSIGQIGPG